MSLEEEVTKLMDNVMEGTPALLEAMTGGKDPTTPLTGEEAFILIQDQLLALKRGIQLLAREIEKTRDA